MTRFFGGCLLRLTYFRGGGLVLLGPETASARQFIFYPRHWAPSRSGKTGPNRQLGHRPRSQRSCLRTSQFSSPPPTAFCFCCFFNRAAKTELRELHPNYNNLAGGRSGSSSMATQWGIKYAVHVISSHFGDLAAVSSSLPLSALKQHEYVYSNSHIFSSVCLQKVCECLLRRGPLSQQNIARFVETPPPQVKNCLLLLIQQNIVQAFIVEDPGSSYFQLLKISR